MKVVFRHALDLAAMKDDPHEAAAQLFRSVGGSRALLIEAHAHYSEILERTPGDIEARRSLTLVEWALTGTGGSSVIIHGKKASGAG